MLFASAFPSLPSIVWITHVFDWNLVADTIPLFLEMCLFSISLYFFFYSTRFLYFSENSFLDLLFSGYSIEFHNFCNLPTQIDNLLLDALFISVPFLALVLFCLLLFLGSSFFPIFFFSFLKSFLQNWVPTCSYMSAEGHRLKIQQSPDVNRSFQVTKIIRNDCQLHIGPHFRWGDRNAVIPNSTSSSAFRILPVPFDNECVALQLIDSYLLRWCIRRYMSEYCCRHQNR